jgi:hypothetical protein
LASIITGNQPEIVKEGDDPEMNKSNEISETTTKQTNSEASIKTSPKTLDSLPSAEQETSPMELSTTTKLKL